MRSFAQALPQIGRLPAAAGARGRTLLLRWAGPAAVASIAYMDPGNIATNVAAGAHFGYQLLWVVMAANLLAMLFQVLAARLGLVTGFSLAEQCRAHLPLPASLALWLISEVAAMATDLAEFLGGAIGLSLLCHLPLLPGMAVTALASWLLLALKAGGLRRLERVVAALAAAIALCFFAELLLTPIDWGAAALGSVFPRLPDTDALTLSLGIVGATVMPHALFLHSDLARSTQPRSESECARQMRRSDREVLAMLGIAGAVNLAMVLLAAGAFHYAHAQTADIGRAYHLLGPILGPVAASLFLVALLTSGLSSSVVGTLAGQMIMGGLIAYRLPLWLRRALTMLPAFAVVGLGVDTMHALILSQVVLSFALPFPLAALISFTSQPAIMGRFANGRFLTLAASLGGVVIIALNLLLLVQMI